MIVAHQTRFFILIHHISHNNPPPQLGYGFAIEKDGMGIFLRVTHKAAGGGGFLVYQHSTKQLLPTSGIDRSDMVGNTVRLGFSRLSHDVTDINGRYGRSFPTSTPLSDRFCNFWYQQIRNYTSIEATRTNNNVISFFNCLQCSG